MAAAADYSGWVRELDSYQQQQQQQSDASGDADDRRVEPVSGSLRANGTPLTARAAKGALRPATSQAEELQQEMKLLGWHKLANEAALKAALIKTSKLRREDAAAADALSLEEREERALRLQQVVEEAQLRPLEVSAAFVRDLEARGRRDDARLEDDVQRHIQHLRRLKDAMARKEDAQRRRRQFRERVHELQPPPPGAKRPSNQDEDADAGRPRRRQQQQQPQVRTQRSAAAPNSVYQRIADAQARGGRANAEVASSLDKLMELEQRIRHLEDAGLGVDALDGAGPEPAGNAAAATSASSSVRFAKRRGGGGPLEPPRTVFAVKPAASKARAKDALVGGGKGRKRPQGTPQQTAGAPRRGETFLTSVPESHKQRPRRLTDRERRALAKSDKAREAQQRSRRQDVVIDDWLDKKRQAAAQRKAASSHVRATSGPAGAPRGPAAGPGRQTRLPPPPRVRAPAVGAASGQRVSALNPHMQRFDALKRGFDKRREMLQAPAAAADRSNKSLRPRAGAPRRAVGPLASSGRPNASAAPTQPPPARRADGRSSLAQVSLSLPAGPGTAAGPRASAVRPATKLPPIIRADPLTNKPSGPPPPTGRPVPRDDTGLRTAGGLAGCALPRIAGGRAPLPSPPPAKNPHGPQFSRLHKR